MGRLLLEHWNFTPVYSCISSFQLTTAISCVALYHTVLNETPWPFFPLPFYLCQLSFVVVRHKVSGFFNLRTVGPRITQFYTDIHNVLVYLHTAPKTTSLAASGQLQMHLNNVQNGSVVSGSNNSATVCRRITTNDTQNVCRDFQVERRGVSSGPTNWWASC